MWTLVPLTRKFLEIFLYGVLAAILYLTLELRSASSADISGFTRVDIAIWPS